MTYLKPGLIFAIIVYSCFTNQTFSDEWKRVYLTSYPRSGNHWMRYLVEEATHIATGSVYRDSDPAHIKKRFPWGGFITQSGYEGNCRHPKKDEIILLKTHYPTHRSRVGDHLKSLGSIRLVRHPVDSFYSHYVYQKVTLYKEQPEAIVPSHMVHWLINKWREYQEYWNNAPNCRTFRYEDLFVHSNLKTALTTILNTLQYNVDDADIERACNKFPAQGHPLKHIDKFTKEDLELINTELKDLMNHFNYSIPSEYLTSSKLEFQHSHENEGHELPQL